MTQSLRYDPSINILIVGHSCRLDVDNLGTILTLVRTLTLLVGGEVKVSTRLLYQSELTTHSFRFRKGVTDIRISRPYVLRTRHRDQIPGILGPTCHPPLTAHSLVSK